MQMKRIQDGVFQLTSADRLIRLLRQAAGRCHPASKHCRVAEAVISCWKMPSSFQALSQSLWAEKCSCRVMFALCNVRAHWMLIINNSVVILCMVYYFLVKYWNTTWHFSHHVTNIIIKIIIKIIIIIIIMVMVIKIIIIWIIVFTPARVLGHSPYAKLHTSLQHNYTSNYKKLIHHYLL